MSMSESKSAVAAAPGSRKRKQGGGRRNNNSNNDSTVDVLIKKTLLSEELGDIATPQQLGQRMVAEHMDVVVERNAWSPPPPTTTTTTDGGTAGTDSMSASSPPRCSLPTNAYSSGKLQAFQKSIEEDHQEGGGDAQEEQLAETQESTASSDQKVDDGCAEEQAKSKDTDDSSDSDEDSDDSDDDDDDDDGAGGGKDKSKSDQVKDETEPSRCSTPTADSSDSEETSPVAADEPPPPKSQPMGNPAKPSVARKRAPRARGGGGRKATIFGTDKACNYWVRPSDVDPALSTYDNTIRLINQRFPADHKLRNMAEYFESHSLTDQMVSLDEREFKQLGMEKSLKTSFERSRGYLTQNYTLMFRDAEMDEFGNVEACAPTLLFQFKNVYDIFRVILPSVFQRFEFLLTNVAVMQNFLTKRTASGSPRGLISSPAHSR